MKYPLWPPARDATVARAAELVLLPPCWLWLTLAAWNLSISHIWRPDQLLWKQSTVTSDQHRNTNVILIMQCVVLNAFSAVGCTVISKEAQQLSIPNLNSNWHIWGQVLFILRDSEHSGTELHKYNPSIQFRAWSLSHVSSVPSEQLANSQEKPECETHVSAEF